ncbi:MAG: hypothetical protein EOP04_29955 [Proteobacteria bacterium]|nr:MAG: hypothetical protein EOP04_29955 [Pseudomonadota bacterium]
MNLREIYIEQIKKQNGMPGIYLLGDDRVRGVLIRSATGFKDMEMVVEDVRRNLNFLHFKSSPFNKIELKPITFPHKRFDDLIIECDLDKQMAKMIRQRLAHLSIYLQESPCLGS